jgi:hypothetical protein
MAFFDATITAHTIAAKMKGNGSDSIYVSSAQRQRFGGVNACLDDPFCSLNTGSITRSVMFCEAAAQVE